MSAAKALEMQGIQELVEESEQVKPIDKKRTFEYNLDDKSTKSKLLKGAKRVPFEIIENSTSSTLVFSNGAWNHVVLPSMKYWNTIKGEKSCTVGSMVVKVASVNIGEEAGGKHIDTLLVFYAN